MAVAQNYTVETSVPGVELWHTRRKEGPSPLSVRGGELWKWKNDPAAQEKCSLNIELKISLHVINNVALLQCWLTVMLNITSFKENQSFALSIANFVPPGRPLLFPLSGGECTIKLSDEGKK